MGQHRRDKSYAATSRIAHVWVRAEERFMPPAPGLVIDWRRHSYRWSALVILIDVQGDGRPVVQRWVPVERLIPIRSDPNDGKVFPHPDAGVQPY